MSARDEAERLLEQALLYPATPDQAAVAAPIIAAAQAYATLAQVDAIEQLVEAIQDCEFPALEIKKAGAGLSAKFAVTPYPRRRVQGRAS